MNTSYSNVVQEYDDNPLIEVCGPIRGTSDLAKQLMRLPPLPSNPGAMEPHIRLHQASGISPLHIPTQESIRVATTIDLILRQSYVSRSPYDSETWRRLYAGTTNAHSNFSNPLVAAVLGISGAGKTRAVERALDSYPQVYIHESFPSMAGPFKQVLWLKIDVPASGKSVDLAEELMIALDNALGTSHFESILQSSRKNGLHMLRAWRQKASQHFLGVLVLDEIQNFFKLSTKKIRERKTSDDDRAVLRIVEDETLKFLLTLANTSRIAIVAAGTPDGMAAFSTRFSTSQRMTTGGFHRVPHIQSAEDDYFKKYLFPTLCKYQWFEDKLPATDGLRSLLFDKTGGVQRIISSLWFFAQRCAFERHAKELSINDFDHAMKTYLSPLLPAITALKSNSPNKLSQYEDLLPRDMTTLQAF